MYNREPNNITNFGAFVLSIDFELFWGVRDKRSLESYQNNLAGVWRAIPSILELFSKYDIHATWSTVGLLFCKDIEEISEYAPTIKPYYEDISLCPYRYIDESSALDPSYHFAPDLIESIRSTANQEISTHTFSHYYSLEAGQDIGTFEADLLAALNVARARNINIRSIIFPRNQCNPDYLTILSKLGIESYRGSESSWFYKAIRNEDQGFIRRAGRLLDTYVNVVGHQTYTLNDSITTKPYNFPSSRLLRAHSKKLSVLDGLRIQRIIKSMRYAAVKGEIFHLWWHPHNFGVDIDQNMKFLEKILQSFTTLKEKHGMRTLNMAELTDLANDRRYNNESIK